MAKMAIKTPAKVDQPRSVNRMGDPLALDMASSAVAKRNPLMVGGGLFFALAAMLVGALLLNARGERRAVVVTAREIPAGAQITRDMLRIEYIEADVNLRSLAGTQAGLLVGKTARERIPAGVLVVTEQVGVAIDPPPGFVLVAMSLEPGELPISSLSYGDRVDVLRTPVSDSSDDPGGIISSASVWSMWSLAPGQTQTKRVLTLAVPEADAVAVGQATARREIRLLARGGGPIWAEAANGSTGSTRSTEQVLPTEGIATDVPTDVPITDVPTADDSAVEGG
jgi:hypothetical protein